MPFVSAVCNTSIRLVIKTNFWGLIKKDTRKMTNQHIHTLKYIYMYVHMYMCTHRDMEKNYRDKKMQLLWFSLFMASPKSPLNPHKVEHLQCPLPAPTLNGFYGRLQSPCSIQHLLRRTLSQQKCLSNSLWLTTIMAYCIDPKHV